ncbi:alpha/beta hydrolase [Streptomyces sp. DSM 44915]|uniref:Alpha/beta hydrolase n=1 Tax=Streptomyces chisholmiae TaxID=3075540 RepID=A0ABU2JLS1_9ACTN|nr:alpha/beta hydrolase [Streptomyces sp. DSM 44915]MDT0265674.1 alpha/beta hydrolase [Streptomyces sp. DSM 44915]
MDLVAGSGMVVVEGRRVPVLDSGGAPGLPVLVALHGTFGRGAVFERLARDLAGLVRLVAPDQRGHGWSEPVSDGYGRAAFVADAAALVRALDAGPVVLLGHSLGGITAYQLAARQPELVSALIVEDVGPVMRSPEVAHPTLDVRGWPRSAPTRAELGDLIRARGVPDAGYFLRSAVPAEDGWRLLFDWDVMMAVQAGGVGDWSADWRGSRCPALLLRGTESTLLPAALANRMVAERPGTTRVDFPGAGHWVHDDAPTELAAAVTEFLRALGLAAERPHEDTMNDGNGEAAGG